MNETDFIERFGFPDRILTKMTAHLYMRCGRCQMVKGDGMTPKSASDHAPCACGGIGFMKVEKQSDGSFLP